MTAPARPPGRPRSAAADEAILRATLELLREDGYRALTMEAVRERAGVGKATLYRRYGSKPALVRTAMSQLNQELPLPEDTGSFAGDFAAAARGTLAVTGAVTLMPRLLSEVIDDPELHALFSAQLVEPRRRLIRAIVRRAIERGEVRPDVDVELAVDMLVGPVVFRLILAAGDPAGLGEPGEIVRAALEGLRPR